jgi:hypothetical protein
LSLLRVATRDNIHRRKHRNPANAKARQKGQQPKEQWPLDKADCNTSYPPGQFEVGSKPQTGGLYA